MERLLPKPKSARALARVSEDRWLAGITRYVFYAGFVWKVVDNKWDGFEKVFGGFDPARVARKSDKQMEKIAGDERIIRNRTKVWSVRDNARWMVEVGAEHGSFAKFVARWPEDDIARLYEVFGRDGSRLGGDSGKWFLRSMGKDTYMYSGPSFASLMTSFMTASQPRRSISAIG